MGAESEIREPWWGRSPCVSIVEKGIMEKERVEEFVDGEIV